jgi:diguanylate cyclase (GGDEF)-like protein
MEATPKRRILVADDDPENASLVSEVLRAEGFEVAVANGGAEALTKIEQTKPELVLLDYNMPDYSGLETLRLLRQRQNYVAVIFVSGNDDERIVVDCLQSGADDYVRKPFGVGELVARVRVRFRNKDTNDELARATEKLRELAEHDDLTGLFNMRSMYAKIDRELKRARRYGRRVAIVMMDLDHFKSVNDDFDHLFGSFVLKEIGQIIARQMRETDFAARYGGDEFLMVLSETDEDGARAFAERLRESVEKHVSYDGRNRFSRTASLGVAVSRDGEEIEAKELVRRADQALYKAKETGRNRVVLYEPPMMAEAPPAKSKRKAR